MKPPFAAVVTWLLFSAVWAPSYPGITVRAQEAQPPFEDEIRAYENADRQQPPPSGGIVFVGSSSIKMWKTLSRDFPNHRVINRGFGGSGLGDSVRVVHRIVTPYQPAMIVLFAGTNDLNAGRSPDSVAASFRESVKQVHERLPKTRIAYISITPAPSRWRLIREMRRANQLIRQACLEDERLVYIDTYPYMLNRLDGPRPELFLPDQLHLNDAGYALWRRIVLPYLPWPASGDEGRLRLTRFARAE